MAFSSWPRVNEDTTDTQYAELFDSIIGTGVRDEDALLVSADSSGLNVKVSAGFAVVAGNAFLSTATETLDIAPNTASQPRTDLVVLRRDFSAPAGQTVRLLVKEGVPGGTISPSEDVRGVYELVLASVIVGPNAATVTSGSVTRVRPVLSSRVGVWTTSERPKARRGLFGLNITTGAWEVNTTGTANGWGPLVSWDSIPGKPSAIPVSQGGTGSTSASGARANLGAAPTSHTHDIDNVTQAGKPIRTGYLPDTFAAKGHGHNLPDLSGVLPVAKGGTGVQSLTALLNALGIFVQASAPAHANGRVWIKRP
ncbi:minor tail protein [Microbacterium phage Barnstormer]|uniref:Minor tail protein n=1 Tax=Microbacterium phage Barnstormer TaxID=3028491 RepID=A0AAE9ZKU3_9CAUD|nr:minor tail protein [Microbacterium phage Barnstormer]WDS52124.1 minor tail protein [Microbacterium phage UtzChips]